MKIQYFCIGTNEMAVLLIQHNADVNAKSNLGTTPLILASQSGHVDTVEALIKAGANVNDQTPQGYTALRATTTLGGCFGHFKTHQSNLKNYGKRI